MSDNVILITDEEPVVLVVESQESTVLVVEDQSPVVLVVNEGIAGPAGQVPEWVEQTSITVSNTAPQNPTIGDLWVDTN